MTRFTLGVAKRWLRRPGNLSWPKREQAIYSGHTISFDLRRVVMPYSVKPLGCDPSRVRGMSERLIISHYENNYGGAVKRLNLIEEKLAGLDPAGAPGFLINGLKREELIAMNSMILHELFFDGLGEQSGAGAALREGLARDFGS